MHIRELTLPSGMALETPPDAPARLVLATTPDGPSPVEPTKAAALPTVLVECFTLESGRAFVDHRHSQSAQGAALRLVGIEDRSAQSVDDWTHQYVVQRDPATGLVATTHLATPPGRQAVQVTTTISNQGSDPVHLTAVSIAAAAGFPQADFSQLDLLLGRSSWMAEGRWERRRLDRLLVDISPEMHGEPARDCLRLGSESGWSSGHFAPVGFVEDRDTGRTIGWQLEHNGGWNVELSRRSGCLGLTLFGPTDLHQSWLTALQPGQAFTTPPAMLLVADGGWQQAAAELTRYRRALRAAHQSHPTAPIVYNDYLNTLMADPSTEKELPLISAAAAAGVEVFCIDAGWFADGTSWWDGVGEWQPAPTRFTAGLDAVLRAIRDAGMVPGLWIEPLAVGVDSPVATSLPDDAFMTRRGVRITEMRRHRLDLRSVAARAHLDEVLDRMVGYGIGYVKLDDNFSIGAGPDLDADSPGDGLLQHSRAWAAWLENLQHRHPELVIENCASGGMTTDYAMLRTAAVQSTSDLQDMTKYPWIAAAAPLVVLPEQAANWGVPQPEMSLEETAHTLVTTLAGSCYLSGHLDRLRPEQGALVQEAVSLATCLRTGIGRRVPAWPLGLPRWGDEWTALAQLEDDADAGWLFVWHQPCAQPSAVRLPSVAPSGYPNLTQIFPAEPSGQPWSVAFDAVTQELHLTSITNEPSARIFRFGSDHHSGNDAHHMEES